MSTMLQSESKSSAVLGKCVLAFALNCQISYAAVSK